MRIARMRDGKKGRKRRMLTLMMNAMKRMKSYVPLVMGYWQVKD